MLASSCFSPNSACGIESGPEASGWDGVSEPESAIDILWINMGQVIIKGAGAGTEGFVALVKSAVTSTERISAMPMIYEPKPLNKTRSLLWGHGEMFTEIGASTVVVPLNPHQDLPMLSRHHVMAACNTLGRMRF